MELLSADVPLLLLIELVFIIVLLLTSASIVIRESSRDTREVLPELQLIESVTLPSVTTGVGGSAVGSNRFR